MKLKKSDFYLTPRFSLLLFFGIMVFLSGIVKIIEPDTAWLLKTGEWILKNSRIPEADIFSYTSNQFWLNHEWLTEVFFAALYGCGGFWALSFFQGMALVGIWGISWIADHRKRLSAEVLKPLPLFELIGSGIIILLLRDHVAMRAQILTNILFAFSIYLFLNRRTKNKIPRKIDIRFLAKIFILSILWTQLHGGAPHLVILCSILCVLQRNLNSFCALVLSFTGTCVGPYGIAVHGHFFESHTTLLELREWTSILSAYETFPIYIFLSSLVLILSFIFLLRQKNLFKEGYDFKFLLLIFFTLAAFRYIRFYQEALIVSLFVLPSGLSRWGSHFKKAWLSPKPIIWLVSMATIAQVFAMAVVWGRREWGAGFSIRKFPVAAVEFAKKENLKGPLFNSYNFGAYLIWAYPEEPVFIDGRAFTVYSEEHIQKLIRIYEDPSRFDSLQREYGFRLAILQRNGRGASLPHYLEKRGWQVRYLDEVAIVMTKD